MRFAKYHGTGNDFIMVEDLGDSLRLEEGSIAALCDRHMGIGADGLIRIAPSDEADFFMDYYNADGQVAEMCGNGIRCLGKYVYDRKLTDRRQIDVMTRAGVKRLAISADNGVAREVTVDMGIPSLEGQTPSAGADGKFVDRPLEVNGRRYLATAVSMGNPHCVLFEDGDAGSDGGAWSHGPYGGPEDIVPKDGRAIENRSDLFPQGTNVEFVRPLEDRLAVRVWERGSGLTMACGTGACASVVASAVTGRTGREAKVEFPGGVLQVAWGSDDRVSLTGPATLVFEGEVDPSWLARTGGQPE